MKKLQNILIINDHGFQFFSEKKQKNFQKILSHKIVKYGKIIHSPKFLREMNQFIKENHLTNKLQMNELIFLTPPNFYEVDKEIIKQIFEDLPFNEIKFIKETNIYSIKKNEIWIHLEESYFYITKCDKLMHIETECLPYNLWKINFESLVQAYLKLNIKVKKIIIFGNNKYIPKMAAKIEKKESIKTFYFENYQTYLIDCLKSTIKH